MKARLSIVLKKAFIAFASLGMIYLPAEPLKAQNPENMKGKILFVVTSHSQKGNTGELTGFYLSEVTHPWEVLLKAGYEIDFVSPQGGKAPVDGFNLGDSTNKKFWENAVYRHKIENTMKPEEVHAEDYVAIHFAGGHGTMWDFPDNAQLAKIAARIYEDNGVVSAVCHGPAGLVNVKLSNGKYLVDGKHVNAFTNEEEAAVKLEKVVPFLLESKLIERGAIFEKSGLWQTHVVSDQRLVTGQNPQSAKAVGEAVVAELASIETISRLSRYEIKQGYQEYFRKALKDYVVYALAKEGNTMAEAYYEENDASVLWLIERWKNYRELEQYGKGVQAHVLDSLQRIALKKTVTTYDLKDLEPLSKAQWRQAPAAGDRPLTVMLFVDSKNGTEENFKSTYHRAMPQFRGEPGVINYQLSQVAGKSTHFVTYEKFRNEEAFKYHLNFPPIQPVLHYLETSIQQQPFQKGLHRLIEFAPLNR